MSTLIYLAWGRAQRPRANLIQTLHTVEALTDLGIATRLYVPPVPRRLDRADFFRRMGLHRPVDLRGAESLHRRWGRWPFALLHHRELRRAYAAGNPAGVFNYIPALNASDEAVRAYAAIIRRELSGWL